MLLTEPKGGTIKVGDRRVGAVVYIRVSGKRQVNGTSLTTQEQAARNYLISKGYRFVKLFKEEGESAKTDDRTELKELLEFCRAHAKDVQVVVFPQVDRFARYSRDYQNLKYDLGQVDIRLESVNENFADTPSGHFMESVLAAAAQHDNEVRSERAKNSAIEATREGRWLRRPPLGFEKVVYNGKKTVAPKKGELEIAVEVFTRLAERRGRPSDIQRWLASQGYRLARSGFYRMIHHKLYIGVIEAFGVTVTAAPPIFPLISQRMFYAAQAALRQAKQPTGYERDRDEFPLRGSLRCGCGRLLTASWAQGNGGRYGYYRCKKCKGINLKREAVEQDFVQLLNVLRPTQEQKDELRETLIDYWQTLGNKLIQSHYVIDGKITKLRQLQSALALKNAEGIIADDLAKEQIDELQIQINELEDGRPVGDAGVAKPETIVDFALRFLSQPGRAWQRADLTSKKRLQLFYFPTGLIYTKEHQCRTTLQDPFSGLQVAFGGTLSCGVRSGRENPNQSTKKDIGKVAELCLRLYNEFSDGSSD